jgi:RHS repeat-associated protein
VYNWLAPTPDEEVTLHYTDQRPHTANAAVVAVDTSGATIKITTRGAASAGNIVIDVVGYHQPATAPWAYDHDATGTRVAKTGPATSPLISGTTRFVYSRVGIGDLLLEHQDGILATPGVATYYLYGPGGTPISQIDVQPGGAATTSYLHHDQIGSTRLLADSAGNIVNTYNYDAYGKRTATNNWYTTRLGYTGQYHDNETGFIYLRARLYDPTTGMFLTRDPAVGLTRLPYGYTYGDPLNHVDRNGLWPWDGICVAIANPDCDNSGTQQWAGNVFAGAGNAVTFGQGVDVTAKLMDRVTTSRHATATPTPGPTVEVPSAASSSEQWSLAAAQQAAVPAPVSLTTLWGVPTMSRKRS